MRSLNYYIHNPRKLGLGLMRRMKWLPDKLYLKLLFYFEMGSKLNLNHPRTFQEKIQWLKLYDRQPKYTKMVDKFAAKDYVANIIGDQYIIPTLGIWNSFDKIDFDSLPDQFVLKTTHGGGGGGIIICRNKSTFDKLKSKIILESALKSDLYKSFKEWPYKNVPKCIIAEQLLKDDDKNELYDYKFFCFNGKPRFLKVDFGRFTNHHANYYTLDWKLLPFGEVNLPPLEDHIISRPPNLSKMIEIVRKLSASHQFIRVDLYNVAGQIYFSELTFYPASGLGAFTTAEWDLKIGDMIELSNGKN